MRARAKPTSLSWEPNSQEGGEIRNVLLKYEVADELYPFKAGQVVRMVPESPKKIHYHNHTQAWKIYKARPRSGAKDPRTTNGVLHLPRGAQGLHILPKWIEYLVQKIGSEEEFAKIKMAKQ